MGEVDSTMNFVGEAVMPSEIVRLERLWEQQARIKKEIDEIQMEARAVREHMEARRNRLLPNKHPSDSVEVDHCVDCGVVVREWATVIPDYHSGAIRRTGAPRHVVPSRMILGGLRCIQCSDRLVSRVLDMLEDGE